MQSQRYVNRRVSVSPVTLLVGNNSFNVNSEERAAVFAASLPLLPR